MMLNLMYNNECLCIFMYVNGGTKKFEPKELKMFIFRFAIPIRQRTPENVPFFTCQIIPKLND